MSKATKNRAKKADDRQRRCIVTGREEAPDRLIRFVLDPENRVVADVDGKLPGRGFWLSPERDVVNTAVLKRLFAKAARAKALADDDLADKVEALLAGRIKRLIGLARRAGQAVAGFEKVREGLTADGGPGALVLLAADAAADSARKMTALAGEAPVASTLTGDELAEAFGRERSVHVLIKPGRLAADIRVLAEKLAGFRA